MVNNYEFIKNLDKETYLSLIKRGFIPIHIMDWLLIYEHFLKEKKNHKKSVAITFCQDEFNVSERQIYKIIEKMEKAP